MAMEVVGGAFLSGFFQQIFQTMDSQEVKNFIRGKKLTDRLLEKLRIKLMSVNAVFEDAEQKQISNPNVRQWLHKLKETILDAEDLLDEIKTEALRRKIEAEYGSGTSGRHRISQTLPSTSLVQDSDVYGRDDDKETLIKLLLSAETDIKLGVIAIVGMGGIGKTTLAQLLYNDDRVQKHFELQLWVYVSEEFDVVKITQTIYGSVTSTTCDITNLDLLQVQIKEALTGKKFLFVLDDVWNEDNDSWDLLRRPFESGAHGSKIIVTTRNVGVASTMGAFQSHNVMGISEEDCWLVFAERAFRNATVLSANPSFEVIGRQIVSKCKGLPLAAKSLGGLLRSESNIEEWESVLNSDIWELPDMKSNILPALWLSYQYLPPYLKRCFAYCSIFPKDYIIWKSELVLLWMAEDLLQPKRRKTMEEVGESYFDHLISRSFFQRSSLYVDDYFIMHDLINDLAKFVSGEFSIRFEGNDSLDNMYKVRHVSHLTSADNVPYYSYTTTSVGNQLEKYDSLYEAKYLRTLLLLHYISPVDNVQCDQLLMLKCLRVLKLGGRRMKELPNSISNLKHLRYRDLSECRSIERLPDTICSLYNLQTLLLLHSIALTELPTHFERLINLRHLDIQNTKIRKMPPHMGKLKDLQTLTGAFVLDKDTGDNIVELKGFEHLRKVLCITGLQNIVNAQDALEAKLRDKKHLSKLILKWEGDTEDSQKDREVLENLQPHSKLKELEIKCYGGITFPGWLGDDSLSTLVTLRLTNCGYCFSMPALGQLPSLKTLDIRGLNGLEFVGSEFYGGVKPAFRSMEHLSFSYMREWKEWSYVGFQLPNLTSLRILECRKLRLLPDLHTLLPSLHSLFVSGCPELESIWEGQPPSKLEYLWISDCKKIVASRMQWGLQALTSLRELWIDFGGGEEIVESFPDQGMLPTTLTHLYLRNLKKINGKELRHVTSLTELCIEDCPELPYLPDEGIPTSLCRLDIQECPLLEERCEREKGEDWHKIAHISTIRINGIPI